MVNNAGRGMKYVSDLFMTKLARFWEISSGDVAVNCDTNVNGPLLMARAAAPGMIKSWLGTDHQHLRKPGRSCAGADSRT
jgi:NAD(P)-dependent dehydrogenase (short-subunit alcohol dehydrogenase family)